ncbi:MAG: HAD-IB family hydrolase [Patescibacteria group bacterium]|mgnify:CR=1 FL=1
MKKNKRRSRQTRRRLVVYDIDGTLFRLSLLVELVNSLVASNIFPQAAKETINKDYLDWINREGDYEKFIRQMVRVYQKYIVGWDKATINEISQEVVDFQKKKVYCFTRDAIREYKNKNYFLLAISGSPEDIVQKFADYFGFDRAFGSVWEVREGRFTNRVYDGAKNKKQIFKMFLESNAKYTGLDGSIAFGDTESDIPILKMVDYPVVFNPSLDLANLAVKKGWRMVVERKNVIYRLDKFKIYQPTYTVCEFLDIPA